MAQITIVIVVTYLTLIFGELVPKRIGMNSAEKIAKLAARPMRLLSLLASPFVWLLSRSTAGVTRLLGLRKSDSKVTEEEIRSIIQEGAEDGEVQEVEQKIMGRVFSLGDRTVESIMTFRSELVWIDTAMTPEQIREQVNREPHNRYPVGEGSLDKLAGVVYLKDLFRHIDDPGFDIRNHLSPAKFFHEGAEVYSALEQLRSEQLGYGIVCDEFGVTRGIVTLKDIFEALVGEIPDGYGEPDIVRREDGSVGQNFYAKEVFDIAQTTARDEAQPQVSYDDRLLLKGLIASSPVPIRAVDELPQGRGAVYDPEQNAILVKKGMDAPDIFRCVSLEAANVQLAKNHEGYSREAEGYKAYAVSYMLCQRYGVDVKGYDISRLDGVLQGQDPREEVPAALTDMRDTFKEMNGRMARAMGLTRASRQKEQER